MHQSPKPTILRPKVNFFFLGRGHSPLPSPLPGGPHTHPLGASILQARACSVLVAVYYQTYCIRIHFS